MPRPPKLFAAWFYLAQNPGVASDSVQAWRHFCQFGFKQNLNPHPLFDTRFYRDKYLSGKPDVNPLLHYMRRPAQWLQPHPLFDCAFFIDQLSAQQRATKLEEQTWLECLLARNHEWKIAPSSAFCSRRYLELYPDVDELRMPALFHYLAHGRDKGRLCLPAVGVAPKLFDSDFYLRENEDVRIADIDPWQHYCEYGVRENRNPHPAFHTAFYRDKYLGGDESINPLLHYMAHLGPPLDTHPLFSGKFYVSQLEEPPKEITPLEHFLKHNRENLASPSPLFSTQRYLEYHADIRRCQANPLVNYLARGHANGRKAFMDVGRFPVLTGMTDTELDLLSHFPTPNLELVRALKDFDADKPTLVCVSHAASKTGAPRIIQKIAEQLQAKYDANILNILCNGGELIDQFETLGPTVCLQDSVSELHPFDRELIKLLTRQTEPLAILVNSAESRHLLPELAKLGAPIHTLVHENARCYEAGAFEAIAKYSDRVIFPSQAVADAALAATDFRQQQPTILPQGLLDEAMLESQGGSNMVDIKERWNIPPTTKLILGCGTGNGRKGLDLFVATALSTLNRVPKNSVVFGWLGRLPEHFNTEQAFWALRDVETAGRQDDILFFGAVDNTASYFQSADVFFLPSRIDPFPCVVNEAMAASKPVVLFDQGSGCVDMVGPDGGLVIPYGDVAAAADGLARLCNAPHQRQRMGARNRDYVKQHLQFDDYVAQIADGLVESIDPSRHPNEEIAERFRARVGDFHSDQKRVLFTLPAWNVSGVNTFVENLIRELRKRDYDASILFTTRDPDRIEASQMPQVPYRFLASKTLPPEETRRQLNDYISANAPCVFVPNYDYVASSITHQLPDSVGVLGVLHCDEDEHYLHAYRMGHYWDSMVAVSHTVASKILQLNPGFEDRLTTIPYGVPVPEARPPQDTYSSLIRVAYSGRLVQEQKRVFDFVQLVKCLHDRNVPFQLTLIGDGPDGDQLASQMQPFIELGLVRMTGRLTPQEVRRELEQHDLFALMSDYEGLPLSLLEAMAVECVPIVTAVESGITEILTDSHNAMISPLRNPSAMANNIALLQQNPSLRMSLGRAAKQALQEHGLSADRMADRYKTVLENIFTTLAQPQTQAKNIPLNCPRIEALLDAA